MQLTKRAMMISESCAIEEFVEAVKEKDSWEVIALAIEEATTADRIAYHVCRQLEEQLENCQSYSRHLKRLINYLRNEIKPHRPEDKAYHLYVANWGMTDQEPSEPVRSRQAESIH